MDAKIELEVEYDGGSESFHDKVRELVRARKSFRIINVADAVGKVSEVKAFIDQVVRREPSFLTLWMLPLTRGSSMFRVVAVGDAIEVVYKGGQNDE